MLKREPKKRRLHGGYNGSVSPDVGSAIFIMDLENEGKLLKKIDIQDQANVIHNYVFGTPQKIGKSVYV